MATAKEHGRTVLAGIIPARVDLLTEVLQELTPEHFVDPSQARIYGILEYYYQTTQGVLTTGALNDILTRGGIDAGRKALFEETYEDFKSLKVDDSDWVWSVHELKEEYAESKIKATLTDTMEIVTKGLEDSKGNVLRGQEDARMFLLDRMSDLDSALGDQVAPHGDLRDETKIVLREYEENKRLRAAGLLRGIQFGIPELDAKVGGIQAGDLALVAAYTNDGKTTLCVQLAWDAAVNQGKNVLFLSTETVNTTVRRRLVSRHSMHPKFLEFGLPDGLNSSDFKASAFNPHEEELLQEVLNDLARTENDYGHMYIHQVPRFATMDQVEHIMNTVQKKFNIDIVICDYLGLLRPSGARNTDRESLSGVIKNAKQVSVSFNKGAGVAFASPWQVSRAAKLEADDKGRYMSSALAETAEATNTPDIIVSILAPIENNDRKTNVVAQVLKHRDGETADGIQLNVDYATCAFTGRGTMDMFSPGTLSTADHFESLIS